jgi:lambda family phage portal protein
MKMNFIDQVVAVFNPQAAIRRVQSREALGRMRNYDAASKSRRTKDWRASDGSANTVNGNSLHIIRNRSRDLVRNNSYAKKAVNTIANNTIGCGIQANISPLKGAKAKGEKVKAWWDAWVSDPRACDFDEQLTFAGIQHLAMKSIAESGECLLLKRRVANREIPIQVQILEGDYIDTSKDVRVVDGGGWITNGVEFDANGKRVGYWLFKKHPGEYGQVASQMVKADDVLHLYIKERPGQVRGMPMATSAMLRLRDFEDYEDAELVRQKIASCFAVFFQDGDPASAPDTGTTDDTLERVEPGIIETLPPGKTAVFAQPPTTQNYADYSRKILQGIAAGFGTTYESMTGDLSNVNFSSGRMGWLEMLRQIEVWQELTIIPTLCQGVFRWFMDGVQIAKDSKAKFEDLSITWTSPARGMIDPVKEAEGIKTLVRAGLKSWSEAIREQGYDPAQVRAEMIADFKAFAAAGIIVESDPSTTGSTTGKIPEPPEPAEGEK